VCAIENRHKYWVSSFSHRLCAKVTARGSLCSFYRKIGEAPALASEAVRTRCHGNQCRDVGVLEKHSTPPFFFFPICSLSSCVNVTAFRKAYSIISRMSRPETKESGVEAAGDEIMSPLRRPKAAAIPTGENAQPAGGPGGPLRCSCGGDHSPIYDDLGLVRRERSRPGDWQAEEDHRERQEKENDARR
jgi:hypothetical protein